MNKLQKINELRKIITHEPIKNTSASYQYKIYFCYRRCYIFIRKRDYFSFLAKLLQARGYSVTIQKLDPYINVDPGTLNPYEHGECYVTVDGAETDLDLGHYERFLGVQTTQANNVTTGKIYQTVITKERKGDYLGKNRAGYPTYYRRNKTSDQTSWDKT